MVHLRVDGHTRLATVLSFASAWGPLVLRWCRRRRPPGQCNRRRSTSVHLWRRLLVVPALVDRALDGNLGAVLLGEPRRQHAGQRLLDPLVRRFDPFRLDLDDEARRDVRRRRHEQHLPVVGGPLAGLERRHPHSRPGLDPHRRLEVVGAGQCGLHRELRGVVDHADQRDAVHRRVDRRLDEPARRRPHQVADGEGERDEDEDGHRDPEGDRLDLPDERKIGDLPEQPVGDE